MPALEAVEHLVGLQAQVPLNPYTALWSRLARFRPEVLSTLLEERRVVRIALMRSTIHLVSADDALWLRPLVQPVLDAELARHREYGPPLRDLELEPVLSFARALFLEEPRTGPELRAALAGAYPQQDSAALAYACRNFLPLVQIPPRGLWGRTAQVTTTTTDAWLGRPLASTAELDELVLRYLAAFGPATAADVAAWSRLTGLSEVVDRLRPRLATFRNDAGRELFDVPDAPRPDAESPAPPRFLPEYDNLLLSHADRSRFYAERGRLSSVGTPPVQGTVLHDGMVCGVWRIARSRDRTTLEIECVARLTKRATVAVEAEGHRYLRFLAPDAEGDVRVLAPS
jgi:Winged helix DNA-binding domain